MHYLTALRSGVSLDDLTRQFTQQLVNAAVNSDDLFFQFACDFVNDTLLAIGFKCEITSDHLEAEDFWYQWPKEQMQIYVFPGNMFQFRCVEQFLVDISRAITDINPECYSEIIATNDNETRDFETPVEYFMQLIAVWCRVYKSLLRVAAHGTSNFFEEPLARINLQIFMGMHNLRTAYRHYFPMLDKICSRLYGSALYGLRYPKSHERTLQTMLPIVSCDFDLLSEDLETFFLEALMVQLDSMTYIDIFKELQTMLENNHVNRLQHLIPILIKPEMLEIYRHVLLSNKGKNIVREQQEILKFLQVLHSKLATLDCFSQQHMESILNLVHRPNVTTAPLACKLYVDIMKCKMSDEQTLAHIIQFYAYYVANTTSLSCYVYRFYNQFHYMRDVYLILDTVVEADADDVVRLLCAHITVEIFNIKFKESDSLGTAEEEIESLLLILPEALQKLTCQRSIGILLRLCDFIPFQKLQKQTIDHIIHYTVDVFKQLDNNFEYPLLMNIFIIFNKCFEVGQEFHHLDLLRYYLTLEYSESISTLQSLQQQGNADSLKSCYTRLCNILKRYNILSKTAYEVFDYLPGIVNSLEKNVLTNYSIDFIGSTNKDLNLSATFIDVYALEVVTSCIIKLSKEETKDSIYTCFAYRKAQEISQHLTTFLKNSEQFLKLPAFRMKAYFCSLLNFYCHLPLKMTSDIYNHLTNILIAVNLAPKSSDDENTVIIEELQHKHPKQENIYIRLMFQHFGEMHKYDHVEIKSNAIWKLCLHYGRLESKFNDDLKALLITLVTYRIEIYKHIVPVLVYNLYRQQPPLSNVFIILLLKKHKHLIDNELSSPQSSVLMKVHIAVTVLQIIEKSLHVQPISDGYNRIMALTHLNIFLVDLGSNAVPAKKLVKQQVYIIQKAALTAKEHETLNRFLLTVQEF